jgi:hypothetical protein
VIESVSRLLNPAGIPGLAVLGFSAYSVPTTEMMETSNATMSTPHHGTSFGGGSCVVGGGAIVGGGVGILLLRDTCFVC